MKNIRLIYPIILYFILNNTILSHDQDVHKCITWQVWLLLKHYHPEVEYSQMKCHFGEWNIGGYNQPLWRTEKLITGAYREDAEDVVYHRECLTPTNTHFWDGYGDFSHFHPPPYLVNYPNSYQKMLAFWSGSQNWFLNQPEVWLEPDWPFWTKKSSTTQYYLRIDYSVLNNLYKDPNNQAWVCAKSTNGSSWTDVDPEERIVDWLWDGGIIQIKDRIIWENIGRMSHLLEDMSVPAHTHYDPHPDDDYYETYMKPAPHGGNDKYLDYDWTDARDNGGLIDLSQIYNSPEHKIRFLMYTTCAIARRFPSQDYWGRNEYDSWYGNDNYSNILTPIFNEINNISPEIPTNSSMRNLSTAERTRINEYTSSYAYIYCIRSVASFLWYAYNQFELQPDGIPATITGISKNRPNTDLHWNENLVFTPQVTGTPPIYYDWEWRKCGSYNSGCQNASQFPLEINLIPGTNFTFLNSYGINNCNQYPWNCYQTTQCNSMIFTRFCRHEEKS